MNLLGIKVKHMAKLQNLGEGEIIEENDGGKIVVEFASRQCNFKCPQSFRSGVIMACDEKIQKQIMDMPSFEVSKPAPKNTKGYNKDECEILEMEIEIYKKRLENLKKDLVRKSGDTELDKSDAIKLVRGRGYPVDNKNTTFASKNSGVDTYWANPDYELLSKNWFLVLNDIDNFLLYIFYIPSGSISFTDVKLRADRQNRVDIQIDYNNRTFVDTRSKIEFHQYLVDYIDYR